MKYQNLFSGKNKKNISKCRLLKILPRVLSVNMVLRCKVNDLLVNRQAVSWIVSCNFEVIKKKRIFSYFSMKKMFWNIIRSSGYFYVEIRNHSTPLPTSPWAKENN